MNVDGARLSLHGDMSTERGTAGIFGVGEYGALDDDFPVRVIGANARSSAQRPLLSADAERESEQDKRAEGKQTQACIEIHIGLQTAVGMIVIRAFRNI